MAKKGKKEKKGKAGAAPMPKPSKKK